MHTTKATGRKHAAATDRTCRPARASAVATRLGIAAALGVAVFGLAACTLIETRPDPSKFYVLDAVPATKPANRWPFALAVSRVQTPSYLDQAQIVSRAGESRVTFSEFNRWLEPMDKGATRVFSNALAAHLGADRVALEPGLDVYRDGVLVQLQLLRLDGELGGTVTANARWRISSVHSAATLATGEAVVEETCDSRDYQAYAGALSRALDAIAVKVAASMTAIRADKDGLPVK